MATSGMLRVILLIQMFDVVLSVILFPSCYHCPPSPCPPSLPPSLPSPLRLHAVLLRKEKKNSPPKYDLTSSWKHSVGTVRKYEGNNRIRTLSLHRVSSTGLCVCDLPYLAKKKIVVCFFFPKVFYPLNSNQIWKVFSLTTSRSSRMA